MLLVERREMIETFLKEIVSNVDYEYYPALSTFLEAHVHIAAVRQKVTRIVTFLRTLLAKKSLHLVSINKFVSASFLLLTLSLVSPASDAFPLLQQGTHELRLQAGKLGDTFNK